MLTPLTYLGGVFFSISLLPPFWQKVALANPILYMVNAFRYGMLGSSPKGKMAPLHKFNPLRLAYIRDAACARIPARSQAAGLPEGLRILDIGCGGGLLSEPLARIGAEVVGADPAANQYRGRRSCMRPTAGSPSTIAHHRRGAGRRRRALRRRAGDGSGRACHRRRPVRPPLRAKW